MTDLDQLKDAISAEIDRRKFSDLDLAGAEIVDLTGGDSE